MKPRKQSLKPKALAAAEYKRKQQASKFFEVVASEEFKEALNHTADPRFRDLATALMLPQYKDYTIAHLCGVHDIRMGELVEFWREYNLTKGMIASLGEFPAVIEGVFEDAQPSNECCPRCDGLGVLNLGKDDERPCPVCKGKAEVRVKGDRDARKLVYEQMGLINKDRGPLIAQQFNLGGATTLDHVINLSEKALEAPKKEESSDDTQI